MTIWNKSFVLTVATSCAAILSVNTQLACGQIDQDAPASIRVAGAMKPDSKPFARSYRPTLPFRDASVDEAPVGRRNILSHLASHISKATSIANPKRSVAAKTTDPAASTTADITPAPYGTHSNAPTVIVRPSDVPTSRLNELSVEVNPLENGQEDEFALKVMVPDSVKVVELVPVDSADAQRSFKISLGQSTNSEVPSLVDHASNRSASDHASDLPTPKVASENAFQVGYKRNPFFDSNHLDNKTTHFQPNQLPRFRSAAGQSARKLRSNLASYRTPSGELKPGINRIALTSLIEGARMMGLGDTGDFVVYVSNTGTGMANDVVVTLDVSPGLDVVVLDREAEINRDEMTLAWHLPSVEPGQEHLIRYRVRSLTEGDHHQRISVTTQSDHAQEIDADEIQTSVVSGFDSEAPQLPFESN